MDFAEAYSKCVRPFFVYMNECRLNNNYCPVHIVDIQIILIYFHYEAENFYTNLNAYF